METRWAVAYGQAQDRAKAGCSEGNAQWRKHAPRPAGLLQMTPDLKACFSINCCCKASFRDVHGAACPQDLPLPLLHQVRVLNYLHEHICKGAMIPDCVSAVHPDLHCSSSCHQMHRRAIFRQVGYEKVAERTSCSPFTRGVMCQRIVISAMSSPFDVQQTDTLLLCDLQFIYACANSR